VLAAAAAGVVCTSACKKGSDTERAEAGMTQLRSGRATTEPRERVIGENGDYFASVRREQLELRARLEQAIEATERELRALNVELDDAGPAAGPRSKNAARIKGLLERRARLKDDVTTVERADERGWDELKRAIERDLEDGRSPGHT